MLIDNQQADLVSNRRSSSAAVSAVLANGQNVEVNCEGYHEAAFAITGTFAGLNGTFEVTFDGTNWLVASALSIAATARTTYVVATGVLAAAAAFTVPTAGAAKVRLRLTALTSGTPTIRGVAYTC